MKSFTDPPIAIIGMGSLFAQSIGLNEYWRLLYRGVDAVTEPPETHAHLNDYFDPDPKRPDHIYCKRGGFLKPIPFDPTEFGIPPAALEATDTSQLLGLAAAKMALADAGYGDDGRAFEKEKTSVILGVTGTQELVVALGSRLGHPKWRRALDAAQVPEEQAARVMADIADAYVPWQENSFPGLLGNVVAGRLCNRLDLGGTNCVVDAACASSLSAVHMALLELSTGRSRMVITGGVDTLNDIFMHMCFSKTGVLSKSGNARPFSKDADGTVLGEGVGLLVLKRLEDAERDQDRIYAVIKGIGSSSDGKSQSIYAPRSEGQMRALQTAYRRAGIDPESIDLIEAHGTGTRVGDQVEFQSLVNVFGSRAKEAGRCALGSVKSMIGHTKAAAGAAGLIKTALALYHKVLPPTLKVDTPDPQLKVEESPFYLAGQARPWPAPKDHPRRAAVSAFGFGGSNFHAVLEEYGSDRREPAWDGSVQIFAFSGQEPAQIAEKIKTVLEDPDLTHLPGLPAYAAFQSRKTFRADDPHRLLVLVEPDRDMKALLHKAREIASSNNSGPLQSDPVSGIFCGGPGPIGKVALVFPGQGSQYVDMAREWISIFPEALKILDQANAAWSGAERLSDVLFPIPPLNGDAAQKEDQELRLRHTHAAQMALGAVEAGMLAVLRRFNVSADAFCGHSYGELTALFAAGWYDLATLLKLSDARGKSMAQAGELAGGESGGMLAVTAPLDRIEALADTLGPDVVLANKNSRIQGVLSGTLAGIEAALAQCRQKGWRAVKLPVAAAFHSPLVEPALAPFSQAVLDSKFSLAEKPVFSNVSATPYPADAEHAKSLLRKQMVSPVEFVQIIGNMAAAGVTTFIEVGPKGVLSGLIKAILGKDEIDMLTLDASSGRKNSMTDLARALCRLAASGHAVDLTRWESEPREPRRPRMRIMLSGANYVNPKSQTERPAVLTQPAARPVQAGKPVVKPAENKDNIITSAPHAPAPETTTKTPTPRTVATAEQPFSSSLNSHQNSPQILRETHTMSSNSHALPDARHIKETLAIVQQGIHSMQALHLSTAQTHQKFLDAQAEAGRTLQEIMRQTQRLTEMRLNDVVPSRPVQVNAQFAAPQPPPALPALPEDRKPLSPRPVAAPSAPALRPPMPSSRALPETKADPSATVPSVRKPLEDQSTKVANEIQKTLLLVVSELTGYPEEMLEPEMDIESDLGIDSIKRVEILSTLEERLPGLPSITPDMLGTLKTLGQIVEYLAGPTDAAAIVDHVSSAQAPSNQLQSNQIQATLLTVVSELTGYPQEMLEPEMDIESDLGIDSIKRVEILSTLEERLPGVPSITPEMLGTLKTLGQIVDYLGGTEKNVTHSTMAADQIQSTSPSEEALTMVSAPAAVSTEPVARQIVTLQEVGHPTPSSNPFLNTERALYISRDAAGISSRLASLLEGSGCRCVLFDAEEMDLLEVDETLFANAAGLIVTAPISPEKAFLLSKAAGPHLMRHARTQATFFVTISRIDGAFGFYGRDISDAFQGALAGLVKTASREWRGVVCKAMDIAPDWQDAEEIVKAIADHLLATDHGGPIEIGLSKTRRITPVLVHAPIAAARTIALETEDVVVITGGAQGVTAEAAVALARKRPCRIVLLGRSPLPEPEPEWLMEIQDPAAMKKAILTHEFSGKKATPKEVESRFRKWRSGRQIKTTLARITAAGARAVYFSQDVRDRAAMAVLFEAIRAEMGPIKGIIHGAGVLEDRYIVEKSPEQFQRVFSTKVDSLIALLDLLQNDDLRYLVLFSSVSARVGNKGQADYAMANEILNKAAWQQQRLRPECKVVSINWGPWDGGMVDPALKREFERMGVALIPLEEGAQAMLKEMAAPADGPAEVVIGAAFEPVADRVIENSEDPAHAIPDVSPSNIHKKEEPLSLLINREIDLNDYPILLDHVLGGKPVVPLALITEWLGHSALHENPGLVFHGIDALRLLSGIKLDQKKKRIRLMAGKARRSGDLFEVDVEIRNGKVDGKDVIHSRATALLADRLPAAPEYQGPQLRPSDDPLGRSLDTIYEEVLFHGDRLKGIQSILFSSADGMAATLTTAPEPESWIADPLRSQWIADPLVLDCAFQMAIIWCHEQLGKRCLPSFAASYRQYTEVFPKDGVTALLQVTKTNSAKIIGDFTFLDLNGTVIAQLKGYEAIMDASLDKAFGQQDAA